MNAVRIVTEYLQTWLLATAPSGDTLHQRIAMDRVPTAYENEVSAIQVQDQSGAAAMAEAPVTRHQIAIRCYGGTSEFDAACAVSGRVRDVLHNQTGSTTAGGIVFAQFATTSRFFEPDTGWPVVIDVYEIETIPNQ